MWLLGMGGAWLFRLLACRCIVYSVTSQGKSDGESASAVRVTRQDVGAEVGARGIPPSLPGDPVLSIYRHGSNLAFFSSAVWHPLDGEEGLDALWSPLLFSGLCGVLPVLPPLFGVVSLVQSWTRACCYIALARTPSEAWIKGLMGIRDVVNGHLRVSFPSLEVLSCSLHLSIILVSMSGENPDPFGLSDIDALASSPSWRRCS